MCRGEEVPVDVLDSSIFVRYQTQAINDAAVAILHQHPYLRELSHGYFRIQRCANQLGANLRTVVWPQALTIIGFQAFQGSLPRVSASKSK
jgi:hypothetical protein